jgi:hypothetical protein
MLPDPRQSASHLVLGAHLTGPLQPAAADEPLDIDAAGHVAIPAGREPLVLVAPRAALDAGALRVEAELDRGAGTETLEPVEFAPWTEAGAFLVLFVPVVDPVTRFAPKAVARIRVRRLRPDGTSALVPVAQTRNQIAVTVLHGTLGRVLHLLTAEKPRLRRGAREVAAARQLALARDDALDRHGADLAVARFAESLRFKAGEIVSVTERESDASYRERLALYRPWLMPTPRALERALATVDERFKVVEDDNELAVAVRIVGTGGGPHRDNALAYARDARLIRPLSAGDAAHRRRRLPSSERTRIDQLRTALRARFAFTAQAATDPALAEGLGGALVLWAAAREALGVTGTWPLSQAQDPASGSRYELGLGVDLAAPTAAQAQALFKTASDPARPPAPDPVVERVIAGAKPVPPADDRDAAWLLQACGLRTVHRTAAGALYVSTLPTFGLVLEAPATVAAGATADLEARYQAPGDPGANVVLVAALASAAKLWAAGGHAAWTELKNAQAHAGWQKATAPAPAVGVFRAAGLPAVVKPGPVVDSLLRLPPELLVTIRLDAALAQAILDGEPAAADDLRELATALEAAGAASLLPLVTGTPEVVVVVGVIGLPGAGVNLAPSRPTGFRWYTVPLSGTPGTVGAVGSRTVFTAPQAVGATALVCLGYARRGATDPYEHRADLPEGAVLDLLQYERVMNVLDHVRPMGVEVNTWDLRRAHVDLDGDGVADPLDPSVARTFRPYRRRRARGEAGVTITS